MGDLYISLIEFRDKALKTKKFNETDLMDISKGLIALQSDNFKFKKTAMDDLNENLTALRSNHAASEAVLNSIYIISTVFRSVVPERKEYSGRELKDLFGKEIRISSPKKVIDSLLIEAIEECFKDEYIHKDVLLMAFGLLEEYEYRGYTQGKKGLSITDRRKKYLEYSNYISDGYYNKIKDYASASLKEQKKAEEALRHVEDKLITELTNFLLDNDYARNLDNRENVPVILPTPSYKKTQGEDNSASSILLNDDSKHKRSDILYSDAQLLKKEMDKKKLADFIHIFLRYINIRKNWKKVVGVIVVILVFSLLFWVVREVLGLKQEINELKGKYQNYSDSNTIGNEQPLHDAQDVTIIVDDTVIDFSINQDNLDAVSQ